MSLLRTLALSLGVLGVTLLVGCSGSGDNVTFQNISERASWSADDYLAFTAFGGNGQRYIYRSNRSGGNQVLLTKASGNVQNANEGGWHPAYSPNGSRVAYAARRGGSVAIYVMSATEGDRTPVTQLTSSTVAGQDIQPSWSPDGSRVVFATDKVIGGHGTGGLDIAMVNADGSGLQYLSEQAEPEQWPVFSPDGTKIAFGVGPEGGPVDIHILDLTTLTRTNLTAALRTGPGDRTRFEAPAWGRVGGPTGEEWIYMHSNRNGDFDIFRVRPTGTDLQQITNDPRSDGYPVLGPGGTRILFTRDRELWTRDATPGAGNEKRLTRRF